MYQDWDMLFLLEGGKRLLAGGTYVNDMFETNPPLIYYFSIAINFLAKAFNTSNVLVFKCVVYVFILYSLGICHHILSCKPIKSEVISPLILTLGFCLLILSVCFFGQREHLMLVLTMPYFFLLYKTATGIKFSSILRIIISFLAALGFALKPYFLFGLLFSELLLMYWQQNWKTIVRLETQVIFWTVIVYLISVAVLMPDFYSVILPDLLHFYAFNNSIVDIITNFALVNALFLLLITCWLSISLGRLEKLLSVITIGFMCCFVFQGKGWSYHVYPLVTLNSLLATLLICHLSSAFKGNKKNSIFVLVIILAQFFFTLIPAFFNYYQKISFYKNETGTFQQFIKIARKFASQNKSIFFFSTDLSRTIPIVYYSGMQLGSRFPTLWPIPGIINRQYTLKQCDSLCLDAQRRMLNYITEDFKRYQPELVYVDISAQKILIKSQFDYLEFMQKSSSFRIIWRKYCYRVTSNNYAIYQRCKR
ncbi:hypothetical protein [Legionella antarctica]|uniref:hypothetical protein n=1 Tax=Legionella antarctica TaxID=2708020 RepID=UPI001D006C6C|nr:hypothetical protein [Legionella antarctica]